MAAPDMSDKEQLEIRPGERSVDSRFEVWLEEDVGGSTRHGCTETSDLAALLASEGANETLIMFLNNVHGSLIMFLRINFI